MRQYKLYYFLVFFFVTIIKTSDAGIFDWFKSKPRWYPKLEKTPLIETFHPKGIRISIGDFDGLQVFDFHAKINEKFASKDDNGTLTFTIWEPKNGRWTYVDNEIELKVDDYINYWYYVKVNGEEYRSSKSYKNIQNLAPYPGENLRFPRFQGASSCPCDVDGSIADKLLLSNYVQCDIQEYQKLKTELDNTKIEVKVLLETLLLLQKSDKHVPTLILTGKSSIITDPKEDIKHFIRTKLNIEDMDDLIVNAHYTDCGILFETDSLIDVERILLAAESKVHVDDNRKIYEPENAECKHLNNEITHKEIR